MSELGMRFLGVAELTIDGAPVHLRRRHSLALLAYLVLTGRPHSREELATLLSDEVVDERARKLLRNALADLSQACVGDFIVADRTSVAFNTAMPHTVDIAGLDDHLAADADLDSATLAWIATHVDEDLLAGFALRDAPFFEAWLLREREHLRRKLTTIAERHLTHYLRDGPLEEGVALARRLLAVEPWQEGVHRQLMRLLARNGQLSAALAQYEFCRLNLEEELGVEPEPETTALYERMRSGPTAPRHNLPTGTIESEALIGRESDLDAIIRDLTDPACRLLTLVGLGGIGKSCLAREAALRLAAPAPFADDHPFADGVFLVNRADIPGSGAGDESEVTDERRIVTAIGIALGLVFYGNVDLLEQVVAYLQSKRMLLVLDDLEPSPDGAAAAGEIARRARDVTLLATSRAPLGAPDEWTYYVPGLELPERAEDLAHLPASRLFQREANRAGARVEPEDADYIVRICRLSGGLPLALKIAAGWLRAASCAEVARQLEQGGALLAYPAPALEDRHISIQSLMDSNWNGLSQREQRVLHRLAVFPGRFDQPAAEAIGITLPMLLPLCQGALVERCDDAGYMLHPLARQYSLGKLARRPAMEAEVRGRHASYYAAFIAERASTLRDRQEAHATIAPELPNLQAAWDWAVAQLDVDLLAQLWQGVATWNQLAGLYREWADTLAQSMDQLTAATADVNDPAHAATLSWLLVAQADALHWQGEPDRALQLLRRARQYAPTAGSSQLSARMCLREGRILHAQGNPMAAISLLRQARSDARDAHDQRLEAHCLLSLSFCLADNGRYAAAEDALHRARKIYHALDDRLSLGRVALHDGRLHAVQGDFGRAKVLLEQSLHVSREFRDRPSEGGASVSLGIVHGSGLGWHREADEHFGRALRIAREMSDPHFEAFAHWATGLNAFHAGDFDLAAECFEHALEIGRSRGVPATESRALHGLGLVALASGNDLAAEDRAEQAVLLATDTGRPLEAAAGLFLLGRARERLGRVSEAGSAYARSLAISDELAVPYLQCDARAGLARVALTAGDIQRALGFAGDALRYLQEQALAGCEEPAWVALTCVDVFDAASDPRAGEALRLGALLIERRAGEFPEPQSQRYLDAFPARRALLQRWSERLADELPAAKVPVIAAPSTVCET